MKVSLNWLQEWVNPGMTADQLASLLTMAGLEVDSVTPACGEFTGVVVAKVIKAEPHPEADRLSLCEVDPGDGSRLNVVCGANNVRSGLKVALAKIGAQLPSGLVIKEAKLRGALSQGMLCSASELGLTDQSEGILELDEDAAEGVCLREYLDLEDTVLDLDITPNRADCLSIAGVARDVASITGATLNSLEVSPVSPETETTKNIYLQETEACPHYCGRLLLDINAKAETPLWMRERLRRSGIRSIHPVVDVTNYVMLELGQPMHAFDAQKISGGITVRFSRTGETLVLLDGQNVQLKENTLLITDDSGPLAVAGVMGGLPSAVTEETTAVFLESACFNPIEIAGVARSYGLSSESSRRFERGVDVNLQFKALERATALLMGITGGKPGPVVTAKDESILSLNKNIVFNPEKVKKISGIDINLEQMQQILERLGMTIDKNQACWTVSVPSFRFDIHQEVDLIEEVLRIHGYDNIPGHTMNLAVTRGRIHPEESLAELLSSFFTSRGYQETINYSFVDPSLQTELYPEISTPELLNPLSPELSVMRAGLWPGLLASLLHNLHRQQTSIRFFENGVVFRLSQTGIEEKACVAGLLCGESGHLNWCEEKRKFDFFDMKGDLQALFKDLHLQNVEFQAGEHPALHPGQSAIIRINQKDAGWCGVLHPRISEAMDIQDDVMLFEIKLEHCLPEKRQIFKKISKFPLIRRDLSLLADKTITVMQLEKVIQNTVSSQWLKALNVFDVYEGEGIPDGKKSLAVAITLQDDSRTLVDHEINQTVDAIIIKLKDELAITLRE